MDTNQTVAVDEVIYPESDGKPMADNTLQWDWIVKIIGELRELFAGKQVFVAGDLLWYPIKGESKTVTAPDVLVAFDRPSGYRGSYKQWEEGGIAPQVVFEILSPSNTREEMETKLRWYNHHGVDEYYLIDPLKDQLLGWTRKDGQLWSVCPMDGFVSPRLGIRFEVNGVVTLFTPDGREFCTRETRVEEEIQEELRKTSLAFEDERTRAINAERQAREEMERAEQERSRAEQERSRAEQEHSRAEQEHSRAEQEQGAKERLAARLRELGVNPDDVLKSAG